MQAAQVFGKHLGMFGKAGAKAKAAKLYAVRRCVHRRLLHLCRAA